MPSKPDEDSKSSCKNSSNRSTKPSSYTGNNEPDAIVPIFETKSEFRQSKS